MSKVPASPPPADDPALRQIRQLTRRGVVVGTAAALAGAGGWAWLRQTATEGGIPWPLRRMLRFNETLGETLFSPTHLAPTFPPGIVQGEARTNGGVGLGNAPDPAYLLRVENERGKERTLQASQLRDLPRTDLVTQMKCVEGWAEVMHFGGYRFLDFVKTFGLATRSGRPADPENDPQDLYRYVSLETPDGAYYVGLDMASALHPQTLLCDTMNREKLTREHGAPLRIYLAVKYGYKSLKRVGRIRFQDERPRDYWADRGYDWYAGL
jgi:DMSO/TMAO reductase YedYZ molybdopterin-dependent catalytic subunit